MYALQIWFSLFNTFCYRKSKPVPWIIQSPFCRVIRKLQTTFILHSLRLTIHQSCWQCFLDYSYVLIYSNVMLTWLSFVDTVWKDKQFIWKRSFDNAYGLAFISSAANFWEIRSVRNLHDGPVLAYYLHLPQTRVTNLSLISPLRYLKEVMRHWVWTDYISSRKNAALLLERAGGVK